VFSGLPTAQSYLELSQAAHGPDLPEDQKEFLALNTELSALWPVITEMKDPPPDSDQWREVTGKLQYLER